MLRAASNRPCEQCCPPATAPPTSTKRAPEASAPVTWVTQWSKPCEKKSFRADRALGWLPSRRHGHEVPVRPGQLFAPTSLEREETTMKLKFAVALCAAVELACASATAVAKDT